MDRHFLAALFDPKAVLLLHAGAARTEVVELLAARLAAASAGMSRFDLRAGAPAPSARPGDALAVLALPDEDVEAALGLAARSGCGAAVVFAEHDGAAWREDWAAAARRLRIHLLGPAALGIQRPHAGLDASLLATPATPGGIALVCQSGAIAASMLDWARDAGIGYSAVVALGDEIDVTVADALDFLASDGRTHSIVLYLEAVHDARRFMSALRGATAAKPVAVLKAGGEPGGGPVPRTAGYSRASFGVPVPASLRTAQTHAGAMFGSRDVYEAALRRAGAVQIRYFLQLFATVEYLASKHRPHGRRLVIVSNGTGPAMLAGDLAQEFRVALPELSAQTSERLAALSTDGSVRPSNPLILRADVAPALYADALRVVAADRGVDGVMALFAPHPLVDAPALTDAVAAAARDLVKPLFACWLGDHTTRPLRKVLNAVPVPTLRTPEAAMAAYATVASYWHNQQLSMQSPRSIAAIGRPDVEGGRMLLDAVLAEGRTTLDDAESKALLAAFRIPVTQTTVTRSPTEAIVAAQQIGFPVAMKIVSPDVVHKSDLGGVALDVKSVAEVRAQYAAIMDTVRAVAPDARIEGIGVEPMRRLRGSREVYVGVWRDPVFGPAMAFGAGGTQVEFSHDTTVEFPPLNPFLARRMIERTRIAEALAAADESEAARVGDADPSTAGLAGVRTGQRLAAVQAILVRVSEMVCELPAIVELDVNPLVVGPDGAVAVDARIVVAPPRAAADRYAHLAIVPYPTELRRDWQLRDGTWCTLRPIDPLDAQRVQDFMRGLSESTRYFRFVSTISELAPRQLARFTQIDYDREMALVVVQPSDHDTGGRGSNDPAPGERIVGVVRYMLNPDLTTCEFAIVVADALQGHGLGRRMMQAIIDVARAKGLERMDGYVLANNSKMLALMHALGFEDRADPEDPSMRLVSLKL